MDEEKQTEQSAAQAAEPIDLEGLIALVEARVVENLTRIIERMVEAQGGG